MTRRYRLVLVLIVIALCAGCDQATKTVASQLLDPARPVQYLAGMVRLQYTENPGAFLGLGAQFSELTRMTLFGIGVGGLLLALFVYLVAAPTQQVLQRIALAMVLGGGASNLFDRLVHGGRVVDFMNLGIGGLRTGIFNIADVAITAGALLFVLSALRAHRIISHSARVP